MRSKALWFLALLGTLATVVWPAPALGDSPGTTVTVTPRSGLTSPASVNVSGTGFKPSFTGGLLQQCAVQPDLGFEACRQLATFNTTAGGAFGPVSVSLLSPFTPEDASPQVNCRAQVCAVFATTHEKNAHRVVSFGAPRSVADFDGAGTTDRSVYRPASGLWFVEGGGSPAVTQYGVAGDIPVPADYNGDGTIDKAVYRPSTAQWFVLDAAPVPGVSVWGDPCAANCGNVGDIPIPADYDGDGRANLAVFRPSSATWFVKDVLNSITVYGLGCGACASPADLPVPADYTGDGIVDLAVYRPSTGQWFVLDGPSATYGLAGDKPVPADWDGDGKVDFAVYRPSTGQWFRSGVNPQVVLYGIGGSCCDDVPVPGDYNADNIIDTAIYRRSTGTWFVDGLPAVLWGAAGDIPVVLPYHLRIRVGFTN